MPAPPLRMNKADVLTATARTFRTLVSTLTFNNSQKFSEVDPVGQCVFFLQNEFIGIGRYTVKGQAKLWDESKSLSANYSLSTSIVVSELNGTPIVSFEDSIIAKRL